MYQITSKIAMPSNIIYISHIPPRENNIPTLLKHFKQFGEILSVSSAGTKASIAYKDKESAKNAIISPAAFLNNRFIKIRYHKNPQSSSVKLTNFVNIESIKKMNEEVCAKISEEYYHSLLIRYEIGKKNTNLSTKQQKVKNSYDKLIKEASRLMDDIKKPDGTNKEELQSQLRLIFETIKDTEPILFNQ